LVTLLPAHLHYPIRLHCLGCPTWVASATHTDTIAFFTSAVAALYDAGVFSFAAIGPTSIAATIFPEASIATIGATSQLPHANYSTSNWQPPDLMAESSVL
jgi:hypothetical protein